jgi:hypothetical protein
MSAASPVSISSAAAASMEPYVQEAMAAYEARAAAAEARADIGPSLQRASRQSLVALAQRLDVHRTDSMTKGELSDSIWLALNNLLAMVNAPPVSPIAWVLWVGGGLGGACVCELFAFVLSCFLLPLCGVKLARPSGCEAVFALRRCALDRLRFLFCFLFPALAS